MRYKHELYFRTSIDVYHIVISDILDPEDDLVLSAGYSPLIVDIILGRTDDNSFIWECI